MQYKIFYNTVYNLTKFISGICIKMFVNRRTLDCPSYDHLTPKKGTKSFVWTHFGLPADSAGTVLNHDISICKHCTSAVSSKGGSTSNMLGHLKLHHPVHYKDTFSNGKQNLPRNISTANQLNVDYPNQSSGVISESQQINNVEMSQLPVCKRQKTMHDFQPLNSSASKSCTLSVSKFIGTTMQPYNLVENKAFIDMINTLNPRYKLPGRKYFSQTGIPKLYNDVVEKIKQELALVSTSDISITSDCWTSVAGMPYITITSHFIDNQWMLKTFCLRCAHFADDHTSENIAEVLTNLLADWELNASELASCTTDNGKNILKAICTNLKIPHISCFGHNINIGVNRALEQPQLKRAISRVKKLQNTIAHSWKMKRDLVQAQELLKMEIITLPSACETRWWSTLKLCSRFLENQLPICKMLQDYPNKRFLMPEGSEISAMEDFVNSTKFLKEITTTLSGENYTTASSILPLYRKIKKNLQLNEQDSELAKKIKTDILTPLSERYEKEPLQTLLRMASFCDPRFRLGFTDSALEIKEIAMQYLSDLYLDQDESCVSKISVPIATQNKGLSKLLEDEDEPSLEPTLNPKKKSEIEINSYLAMPKISLDENPLTWWKSHENNFPKLKLLARKFLAFQGTSVPSERVFSTSGNVITKHRSSLLPKNAEMQVFLFQNKNYI